MSARPKAALRARRGSRDDRLLAFKVKNRWQDLTTEQVNCSIKERPGDEATAKDFRTWHTNVVAAAVLATQDASSRSARKRAISATMNDVSDYLGNTPAVRALLS